MENGWSYGLNYDEEDKMSPFLKPFKLLHDSDHENYKVAIRQKLKIVLSLGFGIEKSFTGSVAGSPVDGAGMSGPPPRIPGVNFADRQKTFS